MKGPPPVLHHALLGGSARRVLQRSYCVLLATIALLLQNFLCRVPMGTTVLRDPHILRHAPKRQFVLKV